MLARHLTSRRYTLRFSILFIFVTLFIVATIALISITYIRFANSMSYVSFKLMHEASTLVYQAMTDELQDIQIEVKLAAAQIRSNVLRADHLSDFVHYSHNLLYTEAQVLPSVQSVIWGDERGRFVIAEKQKDGSISTEVMQHADLLFDPRKRSWYVEAKTAKKMIVTKVYEYALNSNILQGISVATPVYNKVGALLGVFALDIRLDYLRQFLEKMYVSKHGVIFVVTDQGQLVAYPHLVQYTHPVLQDIHTVPLPWVVNSFKQYQKNHQKEFIFYDHHQRYLATYHALPWLNGHKWLIAVVVPERDFTSELHKTNMMTLMLSLLILMLNIALVWYCITKVIQPIKVLVKETEKIKNFELDSDALIASRIKEVVMLTNALRSMKTGLRSFQKYVPASLVRQIIEAGEDAHVGGAKKEIVILFSDIQNFTAIAEYMDPRLLMTHLCEYFDVLSTIISEARGTIDKYIGDSIMAFWGAPLLEAEPGFRAAKAALKCQKSLSKLNRAWKQQGMPPFVTRIGIHMGDAVIGNLGSSERLNYTAIGDAVNITRRLEEMNKLYGTMIIVSDAVYQMLKDKFVLRMVDYVAMSEKSQAHFIYELLGEEIEQVYFDIKAYLDCFAKAFSAYQAQYWDPAIEYFLQCLRIYPQDAVAALFIRRCSSFKKHPPAEGWSGIWQIKEK